jgi:hypothetical protein
MKKQQPAIEQFIHETVNNILTEQFGNPRNASAVLGYLAACHADNQAKIKLDYKKEQLRRTMKDNGIEFPDAPY